MKYYRIQIDANNVVVAKYASDVPYEEEWEDAVDVTEDEYNSIEFNTILTKGE
jgi:hypothetical protein